jgi:hypothetical protein
MNFPALNLREAHERPEGMEEAAVMMVGLEVERVRQGLAILATQPRGADRSDPHGVRQVADYSMPNVCQTRCLRIIHSYTDYVNRVIWKKYCFGPVTCQCFQRSDTVSDCVCRQHGQGSGALMHRAECCGYLLQQRGSAACALCCWVVA